MQIQALFVVEDLTMNLSRPHAHRYIGCLLHNRFPRRPIAAVTNQSLRNCSRREKGSRASWNVGRKGERCSL